MQNELSVAISGLAGLLLSLGLAYIPWVNTQWSKLSGDGKRLVLAGLLLAAAVGSLLVTCNGQLDCVGVNWQTYVTAVVIALVANQGTYSLFVEGRKEEKLEEAIEERIEAVG